MSLHPEARLRFNDGEAMVAAPGRVWGSRNYRITWWRTI
jgi:hypothetical protein